MPFIALVCGYLLFFRLPKVVLESLFISQFLHFAIRRNNFNQANQKIRTSSAEARKCKPKKAKSITQCWFGPRRKASWKARLIFSLACEGERDADWFVALRDRRLNLDIFPSLPVKYNTLITWLRSESAKLARKQELLFLASFVDLLKAINVSFASIMPRAEQKKCWFSRRQFVVYYSVFQAKSQKEIYSQQDYYIASTCCNDRGTISNGGNVDCPVSILS